jgi:hypothetical protein
MTSVRPAPVPTRFVVATALLATLGFGGIGGAFVVLTVIGMFTSGHSGGQEPGLTDALARLGLILALVPAITLVALIASLGLHTRRPFGVPAAALVAGLLIASVPLVLFLGPPPWAEVPFLREIAFHGFLTIPELAWATALNLVVGSAIAWAIVTGRPAAASTVPSTGPPAVATGAITRPKRVTALAAILAIVGLDALLPLVVRLGTIVLPSDDGFGGMSLYATLVVVAASVLASVIALRAALALARGERLALLITAPASLVGGLWAGWWSLVLANELLIMLAPNDDAAGRIGIVIFAAVVAFGLPLAGLIVPVTARRWFEPDLPVATAPAPRRLSRLSAAWGAATALAAVVGLAGTLFSAPQGDHPLATGDLKVGDVQIVYRDVPYHHAAWADIPAADLAKLDGVDAGDGTTGAFAAFGVPDVPPEAVVALVDAAEADPSRPVWRLALFVPEAADDRLPGSLCPLVDLTEGAGSCDAPGRLVHAERWYQRDHALLVPLEALIGTGSPARFERLAADHIPTEVHEIAGVDVGSAVALRTVRGGLVYRALAVGEGRIPELCQYARPGVKALDCES